MAFVLPYLACALFIAWTNARPGGAVLGRRENRHINAQLGNQYGGGMLVDTCNWRVSLRLTLKSTVSSICCLSMSIFCLVRMMADWSSSRVIVIASH
jgi:hypothetical protein